MAKQRIRVKKSISHDRYYDNQKEMAEDFGIKNSSKKALEASAKKWGYEIFWNN